MNPFCTTMVFMASLPRPWATTPRSSLPQNSFMTNNQEIGRVVDPYRYLFNSNLTNIPKLMIDSAGDEFFVPDSAQFYYSDIPGPKYIRYIPNTGHGLDSRATRQHVLVLRRDREQSHAAAVLLDDRPRRRDSRDLGHRAFASLGVDRHEHRGPRFPQFDRRPADRRALRSFGAPEPGRRSVSSPGRSAGHRRHARFSSSSPIPAAFPASPTTSSPPKSGSSATWR